MYLKRRQALRCPFTGYRGLDFDVGFRDNVVGLSYFIRLLAGNILVI